MASCEEKVEEYFKSLLDGLNIRHFGKTEEINSSITKALEESDSKSGGSGNNYPDIQLLLQNKTRRDIPVMIEAKGAKNKLEKLTPNGDIELVSNGKNPHRAVQQYAVNGALHYGLAVLEEGTYSEVVIIGINGTTLVDGHLKDPEVKNCITVSTNGNCFDCFYHPYPIIPSSDVEILYKEGITDSQLPVTEVAGLLRACLRLMSAHLC